ncbi:hypothetical protein [Micromonospora zhanjiangensis]|uniref:Uncharacterized protein n=1 Tax=Micromonospora zhanjiangensis TaxID=1522057 RepID=A0ABV8KVJ8_9ACTN
MKPHGHAVQPIPGLTHEQDINVVAQTSQDPDALAHHLLQEPAVPNDLADEVVKRVRESELHRQEVDALRLVCRFITHAR